MDKKYLQEEASIVRQEEIAQDVFSVWIKADAAAKSRPGQFLMLQTDDNAHILGRPISICDVNPFNRIIRLVYRKVGFGTTEFTSKKAGDVIKISGPFGNGFPVELQGKDCLLIGGGMGIAPLLGLAERLGDKVTVILGYKDYPFLETDFENAGCRVVIATESGSTGIKGTVADALLTLDATCSTIVTCGPLPMIKAVADFAKKHDIETYVSLEEKMACGIGACLGCVTKAAGANDHYKVNKLCVCKDGPVFNASEVIL